MDQPISDAAMGVVDGGLFVQGGYLGDDYTSQTFFYAL